MSESIKTFSFDLQRFTNLNLYGTGLKTGSVYNLVSLESDANANLSSLTAASIKGGYFWASSDDSIRIYGDNISVRATGSGFSSGTSNPYSKWDPKSKSAVASVTSDNTVNYNLVQLSNITGLSNLSGVRGIELGAGGASLNFGLGNGSLGSKDAIKLSGGDLAGITLGTTGSGLSIEANSALDGEDVSINKGTVNVDGGFGYLWNSAKDQILIFDGYNKDAAVNSVGNATRLSLAAGAGYSDESVLSILGKDYQVGATNSYFTLSGGQVAGFVFADSEGASISGEIGDNLKLFYNNVASVATAQKPIDSPTISGQGSYLIIGSVTSGASGNPTLQVGVGDGATITFANKATAAIATGTESLGGNLFQLDNDGNIKAITGFDQAGDQITFNGLKATAANITKGAVSVGAGASLLAVGSGNFIYGQGEGADSITTITLLDNTDTVYAAGLASIVAPAAGEGTVYFFGKQDKNKYQFVNTSEAATFSVTGGSVQGFTFGGVKDALTMTGRHDSIALSYIAADEGTSLLPGITVTPNKKATAYTYTYTDDTADAERFQVSGLDAGAKVSVGGGLFQFNGADGGIVEFGREGATALNLGAGGTIVFDSVAAASLASGEEGTESTYFKINSKPVYIAVDDEDTVSYVVDEKALKGVDSGATVRQAGEIEKIYLAKDGDMEFVFGDPDADSPQAYTVGAAKADSAYFAVKGASATGFIFGAVKDSITGNFAGLQLFDGASDTVGFGAPEITNADGEAVDDSTITKTKNGFQVEVETAGYNVKLDSGTNLAFTTLGDTAAVEFSNKGELVAVNGVDTDGDELTVSEADGAVSIDSSVVEITGGEFTYRVGTDSDSGDTVAALVSLKPGSEVKQSKGIDELWTAGGKDGNGKFKFGGASFVIAGVDNDTVEGEEGVMFKWDDTNKKATAIDSLDENTSVTGNFNGMSIAGGKEALNVTDGTYVLFGGGQSLAGLKDGAQVVKAGGVSDFLTAESGKFTVLGGAMSIADDADGVTFKTDGASLTGIDSLKGSAIGDFTGGLSVNSVAVSVTGDSLVAVVGDNEGVTAVNQLGVADAATEINVSASGANLFGVNENGQFVFNGAHSFGVAGNGSEITQFDFTADQAVITGVDASETLSGDFSAETKVNGNLLQVAGDSAISLVGGTQILGLTGGASVMQADGISSAKTDGLGEFNFVSGGQSFVVSGSGDGVEFQLDGKGKVIGISGIDDGEIVTGNLNGVKINGKDPEIIVKHEDGSFNTNLYYENGTLSGVVAGDTVVKADNVSVVRVGMSGTFNFGENKEQFFTTTDADGVDFAVKVGTVEVTAVDSLASGASLEGSIAGLSVNGKTVDIQDSDFGVVGADDGISGVYKLSDGAIVVDAAGATVATTDTVGKFTFGGASGQSFVVAGDSSIDFALTDNAATAINGLSAGSVLGSFSAITAVNGQTFSVVDSNDEVEVFADADGNLSKIGKVTADATIGEVGSVSQVLTDKAGTFTFNGGVSFLTGDGADEVTFGLSSSQVVSISDLKGSAIGGFSGIQVNGADIDIVDGDNKLKVFGDGTKLTAIQDVDADATINKAGGVAELVGNIAASSGSFTFANSGKFEVAGDSSITFALNTAADAEVVGISDLSGNVNGSFSGISAINGKSFELVDADGILMVYGNKDASDITKITGVTGSASIGQVGSVSQILTDKAGEFAFTNGSWSVAGDDEVTFGMSSSKVVSIAELVGTVEGAFEDVTVNGKAFKISGDSSIALVGSASGVDAIEKLSGGAVINAAEGTLKATTDSDGLFTFADGKKLQVLGDSSVEFGLVDGKLVSIDGLDKTATIVGALNGIAINGASSMFDVRNNENLWYSNGTLSAVVDGNTVVSADGATTVQVVTDGTYTFGNDAFQIAGDKDGVASFTVADSSIVTAINDVDEGATVNGALNGLKINDGEALNVENDDSFGAVAGASAIAKLINLSDGANVIAAGGASQFVTDAEGSFTILGTAMDIESDDSVTFTAGASGITAIDGLEGTATGNFTKEIAINGEENLVQVLGDSLVAVTSEGEAVTRVDAVDGGATVAAVGGATEVGTASEGTFAFTTGGESQGFTVEGADEITFNLNDEGSVIGVSEFVEGKLTFDTATTALNVNDEEDFTIDTTTNASFSIADSSVNYVTGVTGEIDGLVNGTVAATGQMQVNGTDIDVQDDDDFKVIVSDGEVVGLADISGGARVNVAGVSIAVDSNGELELNGDKYNFTDSIDGAFNLTTNDEGKLAAVDAFAGEMVIDQPTDKSFTVNGDELGFASAADSVTVATDGSDINAVNGLVNNDAVYGNLGSASIAMAIEGSTASVKGEGEFLTVNEVTYELLNDQNGITVTGGRQVTDLDENASLYVSAKGKYTVNGNGSDIDVEDTNLPIIGLDGATDAYIYDPAHLIIRKGTPVTAIEAMLGLTDEYEESLGGDDVKHETAGTADDPLTKEETDAIFGASSTVDLDRPLEIFATNDGKEAQNIPLAGTDYSKKVHLFNGDQNVTFNNAGGNLAVVEDESSGTKNIDLGDMGDAVIMKADAGNGTTVDITGGAGDDSVVVQGSAPVNFDMSEGGADKVITFASSGARITLEGYNALTNPNAGIQITERWTKDLAEAIANGLLNFGNGEMSIGNDASGYAKVSFAGNTAEVGAALVNLFNYLGQKQAVGFTNSGGGLVDGSTAQDPLILIGNDKGQKTGKSTLLGGTGDDTAIAGGGDEIDLGAGNNLVKLQKDPMRAGAGVALNQGRTTIEGFIGSFNLDHGDAIAVDLSKADISFDGTNVYIAGDTFYGVIADAITDGELSYDTAETLAESADLVESADEAASTSTSLKTAAGDYTNVLFNNAGTAVKTAIAKEGGVFDVKLDFDARALNYIGDNSGITFYDHTGEVLVNLAEGSGSIDTDAALFSGINKVAAGDGQTTLIGAEANETLIAGTGNDSIWGAGGKNLLVGYNDAIGDKTGQTSFFVVAEADGAANTIRGFEFVDDDSYNVNTNKITADKLDIQVQYDQIQTENGGVGVSGDDVVLFVNNRTKDAVESVIIEGARGKDFVVSGDGIIDDVIAQVNTDSLTADKFANYFVATGKNATLKVGNDIDTANIYLGGTPLLTDYEGKAPEFYGDIKVIDATGSNAKAELGGNEYDNTILAGSGDTSLWGGDGGNDLLVGGTGKNTFFYNLGNGDDVVDGAKDGDVIDLNTLALDDLVDPDSAITESGVELKFTDGGSLTVNSTANVEYQVGGETYVVNEDRDGWTKKA